MLSIEKISKKIGVSTATVSRAFDPRYRDKVKPATVKRIMDLCEQYNYRPKLSARSLASGKTFTIGLVLAEITKDLASPFFAEIIEATVRELSANGYSLKIIPVQKGTLEMVDHQVLQTLNSCSVDGFLLGNTILGEKTLRELTRRRFPLVAITSSALKVSDINANQVGVDDTPVFQQLFEHLKMTGRNKVAYLKSSLAPYPRADLFEKEACIAGFQFSQSDIFSMAGVSNDNVRGMFTMYRAVCDDFANLSRYDTWVFGTDLWALGAIEALREKGMQPGNDIAIVGYDNIEENPTYCGLSPFVTTIAPPREQVAALAVKRLLELIEDKSSEPKMELLPAKLILRKTT